MRVLCAFTNNGNCILCVLFWFLPPFNKQLQQAILHLPTLELCIEMAQTNK